MSWDRSGDEIRRENGITVETPVSSGPARA